MNIQRFLIAVVLICGLSACDAMQNFGQDLSDAGQELSNTAQGTQDRF